MTKKTKKKVLKGGPRRAQAGPGGPRGRLRPAGPFYNTSAATGWIRDSPKKPIINTRSLLRTHPNTNHGWRHAASFFRLDVHFRAFRPSKPVTSCSSRLPADDDVFRIRLFHTYESRRQLSPLGYVCCSKIQILSLFLATFCRKKLITVRICGFAERSVRFQAFIIG